MLKLKLQYFGYLMQRVDSLEKALMLRGIGGRKKRGWQKMRWHHRLNGHEFGWTPGVGDGQGGLVCCSSWGCKELDMTKRLNWTYYIVVVFAIHRHDFSWDLLTLEASQVAPVVKNLPAKVENIRDTGFDPWVEKIPWRWAWQPTPVFLPGESHGQRSLVAYSP